MFKAHRIDPHKIRTLEDLRRIPFTTKQDLLPSEGEPERHKNFILQPTAESLRETLPMREKLRLLEERILHGKDSARRKVMHDYYPVFLTFTSGRSAQALPFAYTQRDLEILQIAGLRLIDVLGIPETTRTVNLLPLRPPPRLLASHDGGLRCGADDPQHRRRKGDGHSSATSARSAG